MSIKVMAKLVNEDAMKVVKIGYDTDWEEYQVRLYIANRPVSNATYHTTDKQDALDTAKEMVK